METVDELDEGEREDEWWQTRSECWSHIRSWSLREAAFKEGGEAGG
jgi:hypothetical protein